MRFEFSAEAIEWRGPAPFCFVPMPEDWTEEVRALAKHASYGWGVVPVKVTVGSTEFTTSLFPRQGRYLVPIKVAVQRAEGVGIGSQVHMLVEVILSEQDFI